MIFADTIAAVATAQGRGGVAIVRVSGVEAFSIAKAITGVLPQAGQARHVVLRAPQSSAVLDDAVVVAFAAPHSYTGEDVVEFQCHGGTVTPRRVLNACFAVGARPARRGEYTQRAFLNGKLDYTQAASVLALVDARTDRAADAALAGLAGREGRERHALYERALDFSTQLEHCLDVSEDELSDYFLRQKRETRQRLVADISAYLAKMRAGHLLRTGALVVLGGAPNAGKSSLMNALLGINRAIVSDEAGTTRDSLEEWLDLDGWPVRLTDTAGIRHAADGVAVGAIEAEGIRRAEDLVAQADVVVALGEFPPLAKAIRVHAKCDLSRGVGLNVSAVTGEGLDELKRAIVARLEALAVSAEDAPADDALAQAHLMAARKALESAPADEVVLLANAARTAADELAALVGAVYSNDLLDNLFSRFCVGK